VTALAHDGRPPPAGAEADKPTGRRAEADEQLRQALSFFRSVAATRFIREAEALLAASA